MGKGECGSFGGPSIPLPVLVFVGVISIPFLPVVGLGYGAYKGYKGGKKAIEKIDQKTDEFMHEKVWGDELHHVVKQLKKEKLLSEEYKETWKTAKEVMKKNWDADMALIKLAWALSKTKDPDEKYQLLATKAALLLKRGKYATATEPAEESCNLSKEHKQLNPFGAYLYGAALLHHIPTTPDISSVQWKLPEIITTLESALIQYIKLQELVKTGHLGDAITKEVTLYENERYYVIGVWSKKMFPLDPQNWSDVQTGKNVDKEKLDKEKLEEGYEWADDWTVVIDDDTDAEGWEYAFNFPSGLAKFEWTKDWKKMVHYVRRRKWIRIKRRIEQEEEVTTPSSKASSTSILETRFLYRPLDEELMGIDGYEAHPLIVEQLKCVTCADISYLLATALYRNRKYSQALRQFDITTEILDQSKTWSPNHYDAQWINFIFNRGLAQLHAGGESVHAQKAYRHQLLRVLPNVAGDVINIILEYQNFEKIGYIEAVSDFTRVIEYRLGKRKEDDVIEEGKTTAAHDSSYTPHEQSYNINISLYGLYALRTASFYKAEDIESADKDLLITRKISKITWSTFGEYPIDNEEIKKSVPEYQVLFPLLKELFQKDYRAFASNYGDTFDMQRRLREIRREREVSNRSADDPKPEKARSGTARRGRRPSRS